MSLDKFVRRRLQRGRPLLPTFHPHLQVWGQPKVTESDYYIVPPHPSRREWILTTTFKSESWVGDDCEVFPISWGTMTNRRHLQIRRVNRRWLFSLLPEVRDTELIPLISVFPKQNDPTWRRLGKWSLSSEEQRQQPKIEKQKQSKPIPPPPQKRNNHKDPTSGEVAGQYYTRRRTGEFLVPWMTVQQEVQRFSNRPNGRREVVSVWWIQTKKMYNLSPKNRHKSPSHPSLFR